MGIAGRRPSSSYHCIGSQSDKTCFTRSFLGFIGITVFLTEDSDDVRAGRGPRLRGDVHVWMFAIFSLLVGEGSSAIGPVRLPLPARGVGARVGGWMLLRCVVGVEGVGGGGGMLGFVKPGGAGRAGGTACVGPVNMLRHQCSRTRPVVVRVFPLGTSFSGHSFKIEHTCWCSLIRTFNWLPQSLVSFLDASRPSPAVLGAGGGDGVRILGCR